MDFSLVQEYYTEFKDDVGRGDFAPQKNFFRIPAAAPEQ